VTLETVERRATGAARKPNGGFKRLLQQELADRFDRLLEG
jgi:hypothetical protein